VAQVRDDLPREPSPWTRRSLDRVGALRSWMPLLPAGDEVRALPPASEPPPIQPADIPELPPPPTQSQSQSQLDRVAVAPVERNPAWAARYGAAVVAAAAVAAVLVAIVLGRPW
jgi:hypothetical protein